MKSLVIYESLYGNTRTVAETVAAAIPGDVSVQHVPDVDPASLSDIDLLVFGSPTHGGRYPETVKDLLAAIQPASLKGVHTAAFDTRVQMKFLRIIGYAAPKIAKQLVKKGGALAVEAEGFFVTTTDSPSMLEGELDRVTAWAKEVIEVVGKSELQSI